MKTPEKEFKIIEFQRRVRQQLAQITKRMSFEQRSTYINARAKKVWNEIQSQRNYSIR
jgi:hypothetical protein